MMKKLSKTCFILSLLFLAWGCSSDEENDPILHLSESVLEVGTEGGEVSTTLVFNYPVEINQLSGENWVRYEPETRSVGYRELVFSVDPNLTLDEREANFSVTIPEKGAKYTILIHQAGKDENTILSGFGFLASDNPVFLLDDFQAAANGTEWVVTIPYDTDARALIPRIEGDFTTLKLGGEPYEEGKAYDFTSLILLQAADAAGRQVQRTVRVNVYTGLPVVRINTNNTVIDSKENYVNGTLTVSGTPDYPSGLDDIPMRIRGRGNYTWQLVKKPYRIKLDEKESVLGMPSNKDWVLLANYDDKSLMRTYTAFEFSRMVGMAWTPRMHHVEVFLNGHYRGQYLLGEHVKADKNRVDIDDDGFLGELDNYYAAEPYYTFSSWGNPFTFKEPDPANDENTAYFMALINKMEGSFNNGVYLQCIDLESFAKWYLVHELLANLDPNFYYYVPNSTDGVIHIGPIWDFDWSMGYSSTIWGSTHPISPTGYYAQKFPYLDAMCTKPEFRAAVKKEWDAVKPNLPQLINYINETAVRIRSSADANFSLWETLNTIGVTRLQSWDNEVQYLKSFISQRAEWLDGEISTW